MEKSKAMGTNKVIPLKYISLVILTLQNAVLTLSMRHARTRSGNLFLSSTAVVMAEIVKFFSCLVAVYYEEGSVDRAITALYNTIFIQLVDTLKVCIPAIVYIFQNNLLYVSASHLDAATYQVTYQLKILTTAMFSVLILRRTLHLAQWGALVILLIGVVLVQLAHTDPPSNPLDPQQNRLIGFSAALCACVLSGLAGIYFEKLLKGSDITVWMRNVQLSLLSLPIGLLTCFLSDWNKVTENGFFFGYDYFVWFVIMVQAGGGLIVAMVVKYADNILKGFATSMSIVFSCIASIYLFDFHVTAQFGLGAALVICSIFLYNHKPNTSNAQSLGSLKV